MITAKDWKHWEVSAGRWHLERWCAGAPCRETGRGAHPVRLFRHRRWYR